ncbi:shikimate dehydrogenase [Aliiroseovarius sp. Z3]|uniref:shikimate dehydrogenase n=1 Tax=Aliiroseovarius sp. Z3 TaxID=2811402 RepID=UPI0023B3542D|nr:shikimate dehydrogenase [Aliiroseovarius sp. Z3]MDE9450164.1 shikimate dehydrogenase [Aliiroseovarius sp. Z3]
MSERRIPLAGVVGDPIEHSLSPRLHGHWLRTNAIPGYYIPMRVSNEDFAHVIRTLPQAGFVGVNVTIPHKETALNMADTVTDRAALIGAANTLIFRPDGKIYADNTDGYGFVENLRQGAPDWAPETGPAAVFGAGGAARAVIASLIEVGVPEIRLANRTRARSDALRAEFGNRIKVFDWLQAGNMLDDAMTAVNTTSLGMVGKPDFRVPLDGFNPNAVVTDLVYTPLRTHFLDEAEKAGCVTVDGLGMLLHQAVPGFERWFGMRPVVDEALRNAVLGP